MADYYGRRADNDVGLIVTEGIGIDHPAAIGDAGTGDNHIPDLHGEPALAAWKAIVDRTHAVGGKILPQLWHQGALRQDDGGRHPDAPSSRPSGIWGPENPSAFFNAEYLKKMMPPTKPMSEEDIADVIAAYARSVANAMRIGFDGIAIHGVHGYLIDTFFWHVTNRRADRWGGDIRARATFGAEVVKAIRSAAVGATVMFRFSQWKLHDYDARLVETPHELAALLEPLADAGVDIFDASTHKFASPAFDGSPLTLAGWARALTGKAAMAVGGIGLAKDLQSSMGDGAEAEDNLDDARTRVRSGEFDLIGVGRALLADPAWVMKVKTGAPFERYRVETARTKY
jgi:2,4-dienoyl-CoA reductase-like NADH-dependent reductase (Old Yellow Enzyme family)